MSLPLIEDRDGTAARARAVDGPAWICRRSADGHPHWVPPEAAHLIPEGMQWEALERALALALLMREARPAPTSAPARRGPRRAPKVTIPELVRWHRG